MNNKKELMPHLQADSSKNNIYTKQPVGQPKPLEPVVLASFPCRHQLSPLKEGMSWLSQAQLRPCSQPAQLLTSAPLNANLHSLPLTVSSLHPTVISKPLGSSLLDLKGSILFRGSDRTTKVLHATFK